MIIFPPTSQQNILQAEIDSHHDVILSSVSLPVVDKSSPQDYLITAPKIYHSSHKIIWVHEGFCKYQEEVAVKLADLQLRWLNPLSKTSLSILLDRTNYVLRTAAASTNKVINLRDK